MNKWKVVKGKRHAVYGMKIAHEDGRHVVYVATWRRSGALREVKMTLSVDGHAVAHRRAVISTDLRSLTHEADRLVRDFNLKGE